MKTGFLAITMLAALALAGCADDGPPPSVPPPPAADNLAPITIFFDYDKAGLTAPAIEEVADVIARNHHAPGHAVVTGFCDTAEHNCRSLSVRRAEAVKDELIRRGMAATAIETHGSSELLVATGRHVREPKNRRVVIDPR